jgi:uncharacterized membrane protein HdeD (DUF308 family)
MREHIKKAKRIYVVFSVLCLALGICLMIWPQISLLTLCCLVGALVAVSGLVRVVGYFRRDIFGIPMYSGLAVGLIDLVLGILLLVRPELAAEILPLIVGVLILFDGMFKLQIALDLRRGGLPGWIAELVLALLSGVCGVLLILNPFAGALALMILMGVSLTVDGIQNLFTIHYVSKHLKEDLDWDMFYIDMF